MLSLTLRVLWFTFAILGPSLMFPIALTLTCPLRCPSDLARLHPICLGNWDILGLGALLHHGHRP